MMIFKTRIQSLKENALTWWRERSERERWILAVWSLALLGLLVWFGLLTPMQHRIGSLERRLPALESLLGKMRSSVAAGTHRSTSTRHDDGDLRGRLSGLLAERKLSAELKAISTTRVEMRLPEMPVAEAFTLLDLMRRESGARVVTLGIKAEPTAATLIRVVAELERR
ncbi:type II secretion system protein GspM [Propionivibrio dicarboxylicus]|uniref:Type II secretory pathway, component PulM n=1 Tax=Propionivibrio dicarboxylicus TaxID=83767 RepID=A0A1G8AL75_9RHOO|nr:type II secretion system protein GspM [Propionivibrio dicarboxylicus]SDH21603.1 Type II secretory pathway, component PulM [Propionivibrio dicarboxylicus]